jgi:hypothetical protein
MNFRTKIASLMIFGAVAVGLTVMSVSATDHHKKKKTSLTPPSQRAASKLSRQRSTRLD